MNTNQDHRRFVPYKRTDLSWDKSVLDESGTLYLADIMGDIMGDIMADWPTALSAAQSATWPTIFGRQLSASATSPTKSNEKLKIGCAQFQTDNK